MQRTTRTLPIRVGEDKTPITLTDSAVEAVQGEAAGRAVEAFAGIWSVEEKVVHGDGFASLELGALLEMRDYLRDASEIVDVLIECRPLDELETGED